MLQTLSKLLPEGFPTFIIVGGIGFIIDASILSILVHGYGWGDYTARIVSFAVAVTATWYLNRRYVFYARKTLDRRREFSRYLAVQLTGMAINFLAYSLCIANVEIMDQWPVLALAVGSAVALVFNFVGARLFVFHGDGTQSP